MKKATQCIHAGSSRDTVTGGLNTPIYASSAYEYLDRDQVSYPRHFNTYNQKVIEQKLAALENGEDALVFASGMAAISTTLLTFLGPGDELILQNEVYGGSHAFATHMLKKMGLKYTLVDRGAKAIRQALTPATKLIYIETPTNPLLNVVDIRAVAEMGRESGCLTIIDNTFATPILQRPLELGLDISLHSGTKYLGGHSDLTCGAVVTSKKLGSQIRNTATHLGGNLNPLTCYLLERSLKTLAVRVKRQTESAGILAEKLKGLPGIAKVIYPGLSEHPGHELARFQMEGFGAMLSFVMDKSPQETDAFLKALKLIVPAVSLGGVETTICDPARTSHAKVSESERLKLGITPGLLRVSVGLEDPEDLLEDVVGALG